MKCEIPSEFTDAAGMKKHSYNVHFRRLGELVQFPLYFIQVKEAYSKGRMIQLVVNKYNWCLEACWLTVLAAYRGPGFHSQRPCGGSQPTRNYIPEIC